MSYVRGLKQITASNLERLQKGRSSEPLIYNGLLESLRNDYCEAMNCYLYGFMVMNNLLLPDGNFANPGFTQNKGGSWRINTIEKVLEDLKNLGFSAVPVKGKYNLKSNQFLVKFYIREDENDFHFIRKLRSGYWVHKMGWDNQPVILGKDEPDCILTGTGFYIPKSYFIVTY